MENVEQTPEQLQWTAIHSNLDALGQLIGLSEEETLALQVHIAPEEPLGVPLDLEPAAWKLRAAFDEWRTAPAGESSAGQAIRTAQETRAATARSIMARLLGRRHPYQAPQAFGTLTAERKSFEIPPMVEAVESITDAMLEFKIAQTGEKITLVTPEAAPEAIKLIRPVRETQSYALETGPELLADEVGQVSAYIHVIGSHPILTVGEEAALFRRMHAVDSDGERTPDAVLARTQIVIHNLRLVLRQAFYTLANKPEASNMLGDLIQVGNMALMQTIEKFELERGNRLSTFAVVAIRKRMIKWVSQMGHYEVGSNLYRIARNREISNVFEETRKVEPNVTLEQVASRLGYGFLRLAAVSEDRQKEIPDPGMNTDELETRALSERVWRYVDEAPDFTPRQREVLKLIYIDGLTLQQIAELQGGISHQAISQLHLKALDKIRRHFGTLPPSPPRRPNLPTVESLLEAAAITPTEGQNLEELARNALIARDLSSNEIDAITLRYGLHGKTPLTYKQIEQQLGVGPTMARYYVKQGLKKLAAAQ
jgi:RNA polymerase sigma-B factor